MVVVSGTPTALKSRTAQVVGHPDRSGAPEDPTARYPPKQERLPCKTVSDRRTFVATPPRHPDLSAPRSLSVSPLVPRVGRGRRRIWRLRAASRASTPTSS